MNNIRYLLILVVTAFGTIALGSAKPAFGQDIYNSNGFENPFVGYLVGNACPPTCAGQDGWTGVPPLSPAAAVVATDLVYAGQQSIRVRGRDLVHQVLINESTHGYYHAIGSYRRPVNYDVAAHGFPIIRIEGEVRVDGPLSAPRANFFSASIGAIAAIVDADGMPGVDGVGELAISSDGHVYGYCGCELVPAFQASAPITLGAWHKLAIDVDFYQRAYTFYVDDIILGGPFPFPGDVNTNILRRGSLIAYDRAPVPTTNGEYQYVAHYDNFSIATR